MKAFSGFTPNVLDITERKSYPKTKKIKNISRIHHVKYNYSEAKTIFHAGNTVVLVLEKNLRHLLYQKHQNLKKR